MKYAYLKKEDGAILVITALIMTALLGVCALVVDVGAAQVQKQRLKNAIDAACLAAVADLPNTAAATITANQYIELNGLSPSDVIISFEDSNRTINISASKEVDYTFARILGINSTNVSSDSAATKTTMGGAFDYALFSGGENKTLALNGSSFYIGGSAHSNYKLKINGSGTTVTGACEAVSGLNINGSSINIGHQDPNSFKIDMPDFSQTLKSQAIAAGEYYGTSQQFNGSMLSLDSPIFVNGNVSINGSSFTGKGCIVATGDINFNGSNLNNTSNDAVCFYSLNGNVNVNGSSAVLDGIIYAPNGSVVFNGSSQKINGRAIGKEVLFNGSGTKIISGTKELESLPSTSAKLIK